MKGVTRFPPWPCVYGPNTQFHFNQYYSSGLTIPRVPPILGFNNAKLNIRFLSFAASGRGRETRRISRKCH